MKLALRVAAGILLAVGALYSVNRLLPNPSFGSVELYAQRHRQLVLAENAKRKETERAIVTGCRERHPDEQGRDAFFACLDDAGVTMTDRAMDESPVAIEKPGA